MQTNSGTQATGFSDTAPIIREQTVKSVLLLISKLSDRVINGDLLKCLAKTANDEQPGIRTNTTICLGKIARNLGTSVGVTCFIILLYIDQCYRHARRCWWLPSHGRYEIHSCIAGMQLFKLWLQHRNFSLRMTVLQNCCPRYVHRW